MSRATHSSTSQNRFGCSFSLPPRTGIVHQHSTRIDSHSNEESIIKRLKCLNINSTSGVVSSRVRSFNGKFSLSVVVQRNLRQAFAGHMGFASRWILSRVWPADRPIGFARSQWLERFTRIMALARMRLSEIIGSSLGCYAARWSVTIGKCRRLPWKATFISKCCPGLPATNV